MFLKTFFVLMLIFFYGAVFTSIEETEYSTDVEDTDHGTGHVEDEPNNELRFEGDILGFSVTPENINAQHNALSSPEARWPGATVKFRISSLFNCFDRCVIYEAMREIELKSCVSFTEIDEVDFRHKDYVYILSGSFCASDVGHSSSEHRLFLNNQCLQSIGTPVHELMHTLGFFHEHTRRDRDDYVIVNYTNVEQGQEVNFQRHDFNNVTSLGFPYDWSSVMHYESIAFSKNGHPTITVRGEPQVKIGQRVKLSEMDVNKLNKYYNCRADQIGCMDTNPKCKKAADWENRCQYDDTLRKDCRKTCKLCQTSEHIEKHFKCDDPIRRCRHYAKNHKNEKVCRTSLRKIMHKPCFTKCGKCW